MAMFPDRDGEFMMVEPGTVAPGYNRDVVRIVMHQTWRAQTITNHGERNCNEWSAATRKYRADHPGSHFGVSAHFTIEADGRIYQHVDTSDGAKGTACYSYDAIHLEFAAKDEPLTNDQIFYGANLMAWIQKEHPHVRLVAVGTSNKDPGDRKQHGITCHSFVEIVGKAGKPKLNCPGPAIVEQMNMVAILASVRRAVFPVAGLGAAAS